MTYLELVKEAIKRSGARIALPNTLAGATDTVLDFAMWVQDAWRELQEESPNWFFRQKLDQTLAISPSVDAYSMPSGLETLNYRTVSIYKTAKTDEHQVDFVRYEDWRMKKDTVAASEGRPIYITERPDGAVQLWPVPDDNYTLRYDGVWDIDTMSADADTPGSNVAGVQLLPTRYHHFLVWEAVQRHGEHHQDPELIAKSAPRVRAQRALLSERQMPPVYVKAGVLTGSTQVYPRY